MSVPVINRKVEKALEECIYSCFTPDLPELRYSGIQEVFLYSLPPQGSIRQGKEIRIGSSAVTLASYHAFSEVDYARKKTAYITEATHMVDNLSDDIQYLNRERARVHGRIFRVGMVGLQKLDQLYMNGLRYTRTKRYVCVKPDVGKAEAYKEVWMYLARPQYLFKYDPHTKKYNKNRGDLLRIPPTSIKMFGKTSKPGYNFILDN